MNFMDAVNNMQAGRRLIRQGWAGYYLTMLANQNYILNVANGNDKPVVNIVLYTPTIEDILASDWIVKL